MLWILTIYDPKKKQGHVIQIELEELISEFKKAAETQGLVVFVNKYEGR